MGLISARQLVRRKHTIKVRDDAKAVMVDDDRKYQHQIQF